MEDDGDDKDDSKRRTRNLSEKKRRDQFNMLVTELSTLITTNNRKMDKSTVLKSTISFLKNHNEVTVRSRAHDVQEDWKPAFLSNEEFTYLVLEALEGFVMVFSVCGRIYYVSESITSLLGHNPVDIMNRNIFDLTFEEDRPNLYDMLHRNAIAAEQMPNTSKESEMITFQLHLRRGTLDFREEASYDLVQFYGHFRPNQDQVDEDGDRMVYQQDHDSRMLFICIGRLHTPQLIRDVSLVDSSRNEFTSRHSLEWKFLFLDHRAPPIIGYLPFEVLGTSGYDYYHFDDLEKVVTCHEALMQKGELTSCYYRFLTKGQQWIWLQTRFYITYHQWNSKPEFVVCTHRVVSYADVVTTTKEEGVEDADVSETEANQNSIKELPNDGDEPMPPMSPSYVSEASDAYGNYQPISQSETPQVRLLPDTKVKFPSPIEQSESKLLQTSLSDTYIQETSQLSAATAPKNSLTEEVHQTNATLSQSVSVQKAISQSNTLQAMSNSHKDAILQSNAGNQAIPQSNMLAMSQFDAEVQEIMQSNAAISNIQPISKSNPEAQAISNIPTVLITKPPMTSFSRIFLASESPSYPMEMVTDDFGNSFQQASQNMLATPSPMPQSLSPSHESEHSDSHFNFYQTISQPASVKSASAGSTAGTINTAATTGASWPQTRYAAGSDAGSLSGESRSSQRNSERESHKTTETSLTPQHGIGAQYLDPAAYGSVVPAGMMPVSPVLVTSDHAQIQAQLQRKHEELQQMIVRQQEELRQVKEQLLLARLGLLQPLINVSNPYSTPEEIQNQQRMSAQLAYTNSPPRAIGYPQHVPLPMSALAVHPPHPQPQHPQPPHPQPQHPQPQHPQPPHPQPQHPHHPQHPTQPPHSSHPPQPPHPPHSSEPHQHMPQ